MILKTKKQARTTRVRAAVKKSGRPRLTVHRTNLHIWAQIVDDSAGKTLVSLNTKALKPKKGDTKTTQATQLGTELAKMALAKKIKTIVFDRGAYKYHGRIKAVAEAARLAGLEF